MAYPQAASQAAADLAAEVRRLAGEALGRPIGDAENPSRETEGSWDSFTHVELVLLVEDHFQIRFDGREIAGLQDVGQIIRLVESRLAS
jgi:acyl carrier protein